MKEREKRRALGRGLGALIPTAPAGERPVDVFFGSATAGTPGSGPIEGPGPAETSGATSQPTPPTEADPTGPEQVLQPVPGASFAELPVGAIRPNPRQPRTVFDEDDMAELVH